MNKSNSQQAPLNLLDFDIFVISDADTRSVKGQGAARSHRRTGDCAYSQRNGVTYDCYDSDHATGCNYVG